jgi:hypothetical protein
MQVFPLSTSSAAPTVYRISTLEFRNSNIEFGIVRASLPYTFHPEEWELKAFMRKNEGMHAAIAPEEEVSQNGRRGRLTKRDCGSIADAAAGGRPI